MSKKFKQTLYCNECGKGVEVEFDGDQSRKWTNRSESIQNIFPEWTSEQRELLLSGLCQECWDRLFKHEE